MATQHSCATLSQDEDGHALGRGNQSGVERRPDAIYAAHTSWKDTGTVCAESACNDGIDDNGSGAADCLDASCAKSAMCADACPQGDIGTATGSPAFQGTILEGGGNRFTGSCVSGGSPGGADVALRWTAPTSGCYDFNTIIDGQVIGVDSLALRDAALLVVDNCADRNELACSEAAGFDNDGNRVLVHVEAGKSYLIVVDGRGTHSSATGRFNLNIHERSVSCQ